MPTRVLIADPEKSLVASYQSRLTQEGFEVKTANDGLECLEALRTFKPDVLVLEPELPWGGGDGVLDAMHDFYELPLVPVFVITSHSNLASVSSKRFPLVTHIQSKPVDPDQLVRLVRHIADEPKPRAQRTRKPASRSTKLKRSHIGDGQPTYAGANS